VEVVPSNEINYLHIYTSGLPQKLVDSYRRRQHNHPENLLKKLWTELEDRFGNPASITNLAKLCDSSKFSDENKAKLQAFSDLCADIEAQMDYLPGLAYLNYPNTLRPIFSTTFLNLSVPSGTSMSQNTRYEVTLLTHNSQRHHLCRSSRV
jgi:hypothetical protein